MRTAAIKIDSVRDVPGVGTLYLARRTGDPDRRIEFIDAVDPGTPRSKKWILMISTQFGCAVGCRICDAGSIKYRGNLDLRELLAQVRAVFSSHPETEPGKVEKLKLHFARMGEPSLNPDVPHCIEHLARAGSLPGLVPSISTVAPSCRVTHDFLESIFKLKESYYGGGRFQLQFSVHSTDEKARRDIIPVRKWDLGDIAAVGKRWWRKGDRRVTLNFALAQGVPFDPEVVSRLFSPEHFLLKFTPVHPTRRADENGLTHNWYQAPANIEGLREDLERRGFQVIVNPPWPEEIRGSASCGQLVTGAVRDALKKEEAVV